MDEQQYTEWFNKGYELSKHKPELAGKISIALKEHSDERASGFKDGQRQYNLEKDEVKQPGYLRAQNYVPNSIPGLNTGKNKDIEKDRD